MPLWFVLVLVLSSQVICLVSVRLGAYLMWCRHTERNPLRSGLEDFLPPLSELLQARPKREELTPAELAKLQKRANEGASGFYS